MQPLTSNQNATADNANPPDDPSMRDLHSLLLETEVMEGKLVCGHCGHEYRIKEGIANFLLPSHLGKFLAGLHCPMDDPTGRGCYCRM